MVYIFGHKNPDTDSICSSLVMEKFEKNLGLQVEAKRLGNVNKETQYVLDYLGIEAPELLEKVEEGQKVVLVDPILQDSFINKRINKKIDKIIKFMIRILNDEGTTDEDTGMVLDEINRLKGIIINKYREFMKESEYKSILTKLILIEEEFKKSYNQKMYSTYLDDNIYEEEITSFRGR